jgi:hypothetical protein
MDTLRPMRKVPLCSMLVASLVACGPSNRSGANGDDDSGDGGQRFDGGNEGSGSGGDYIVYAHSDTVLYSIDLDNKSLVTVGNFNAPGSDAMTDLAVAPDGTLYVVSETAMYTASPTDGHVTMVGSLAACGSRAVALTTTPSGDIWTGDFKGALCKIDVSTSPPTVGAPITMGSNMALTGDFVAVDDGTVFGTAYNLKDGTGSGTQANNVLVKIDLTTGAVTQVGSTGYPVLYGTAFQEGKVFAFTHDGTGHVVTIDTTTGVGTLYNTFVDPNTSKGIAFAGAGVSSLVQIF